LSSLQLNNLSKIIGQLTQLKKLELSYNPKLRELPLSLGELSQLSYLDIGGTPILYQMKKLKLHISPYSCT
jgi:Leucine-rich repeat (LRR) protein